MNRRFNIIGSFVLTAFYAATSPVQQYFRMYYDFFRFCLLIGFVTINGITAMVNFLEVKGHALLEKEGDELLKKWKNDSIKDPNTQTEAYLNKGALSEGYHWLKDKLKFVWGVNRVIHFFESCGEKMTKRRQRWQEQFPKRRARLKRLFKSNAYESIDSSSSDSTGNTNPTPSSDDIREQVASSEFNSKDTNKLVLFVNYPSPIAM